LRKKSKEFINFKCLCAARRKQQQINLALFSIHYFCKKNACEVDREWGEGGRECRKRNKEEEAKINFLYLCHIHIFCHLGNCTS
jgi:hypothetical protein